MCVCVCSWVCTCTCVCSWVCMCTCVCMCVFRGIYVHMCVCTCVCLWVCTCTHVWRPEVNLECLPQLLSYSLSQNLSLTFEFTGSVGLLATKPSRSCPVLPVLGSQTSIPQPICLHGFWGGTWVLMLCSKQVTG